MGDHPGTKEPRSHARIINAERLRGHTIRIARADGQRPPTEHGASASRRDLRLTRRASRTRQRSRGSSRGSPAATCGFWSGRFAQASNGERHRLSGRRLSETQQNADRERWPPHRRANAEPPLTSEAQRGWQRPPLTQRRASPRDRRVHCLPRAAGPPPLRRAPQCPSRPLRRGTRAKLV